MIFPAPSRKSALSGLQKIYRIYSGYTKETGRTENMELLRVDTLEEAGDKLEAAARYIPLDTQRIAAADALGRILFAR